MQDGRDCDCLYGERWDPLDECWLCRKCQMPDEEQTAKPWHLFEMGKYYGYPDCCVWAFSLGWNVIDALVELSGAGIPDDQADETLTALGHVPCIRCIRKMTAAEGDEAAA